MARTHYHLASYGRSGNCSNSWGRDPTAAAALSGRLAYISADAGERADCRVRLADDIAVTQRAFLADDAAGDDAEFRHLDRVMALLRQSPGVRVISCTIAARECLATIESQEESK